MKTLTSRLNRGRGLSAGIFTFPAIIGLLVCPLLSVRGASSGGSSPPQFSSWEEVALSGWIDLSLFGVSVDGDNAAFMKRHGSPQSAHGGIEDFHFETYLGDAFFAVDGRAIVDHNDFSFKFKLENYEKGFIRAGFSEYRTWYDGSGGFFPQNDMWINFFEEELAMDRGSLWFEAGLTVPDLPEITFKYTYRFREGKKDSLSWGDTAFTGGFGRKHIVPSFLGIDEETNLFELDLKHTIGKTKFGAGLRYEITDYTDSRNMRRTPFENSDRYVTQTDTNDSDAFSVHAFAETQLRKNLRVTAGLSATSLDADFSGDRIIGSDFNVVFDPLFQTQSHDPGFVDLVGNSEMEQYVLNLNFIYNHKKNLHLISAFRFEKQDVDVASGFLETNFLDAPTEDSLSIMSDKSWDEISVKLEARYTGKENMVLFARADLNRGDGLLTEREIENLTSLTELDRNTDFTRNTQKYTAGINWYPKSNFNASARYYYKNRDNNYDHLVDDTLGFPGFVQTLDFATHDINIRATWRPDSKITLVSRYDYQVSDINTSAGPGFDKIQSGDLTKHIISETVTWNPLASVYFQGSINYIMDEMKTPASQLTGGAANLVLLSENDYWNLDLNAGVVLNEKTDVQFYYNYYRADNYTDNSEVSLPYGAGAKEHRLSVTLNRRVSENMRITLRYAFFSNREETTGGNNDFDAHLIYSGLQYRF